MGIRLLLILLAFVGTVTDRAEAQRDSDWRARYSPFQLPRNGARGDTMHVARLPTNERLQAYEALLDGFYEARSGRSGRLNVRLLSHARGYSRFSKGDPAFLQTLASRAKLIGVCDTEQIRTCGSDGYKVVTVSRFYRIGENELRAFVLWQATSKHEGHGLSFAAEDVYLLRRVRGRWVVAKRETVMIT